MMFQPRAQSIGDLLDTSFDLYKRHFLMLITISGIFFVPARILMGWLSFRLGITDFGLDSSPTRVQIEQIVGAMGVLCVGFVAFSVFVCIESGAVSIAVADCYFGNQTSVRNTYRKMRGKTAKLLGSWALVGMTLFAGYIGFAVVAMMVVGAIIAALSQMGPEIVQSATQILIVAMVFGIIICIAGIFVTVGAFVTPIVVVEGIDPASAIKRNMQLIHGNIKRLSFAVIGSFMFVTAMDTAIGYALSGLVELLVFSWLHVPKLVHNSMEVIIGSGVGCILHPFTMVALTLFYFDQRVRKDGLDVAIAIQNVESTIMQELNPAGQTS